MWFSPQATKIDPIRKRFQKFVPLLVGLLGFFFCKPKQIAVNPANALSGRFDLLLFLNLAQHLATLTLR